MMWYSTLNPWHSILMCVPVPAVLLLTELPASAPEKAAKDDLVLWGPIPMCKSQKKLLTLGYCLRQPQT